MNKLTISLTIFAMALGGCGDDDRDGDDTITLMDSGPATDMGTGTDLGTGTDMGGPTGACANDVMALPADFFPRCSAETFECAGMAADGTALLACLDADTTPVYMGMAGADCGACYNNQLVFCADSMGCHPEWAAFNCCVEDNGCTDQSCVETNCGAEQGSFSSCLNGLPMGACNDLITACFEMPSP